MNISWNTEEYKQKFGFVPHCGEDAAALLEVLPGMKILDLGCGNGALTKKLNDMGADAVGIDASDAMLEAARRDYPEIRFYKKDAADFTMEERFDAVFSNSVFHWIDNQKGLLKSVSGVLRTGGRLVCEFGGRGCCENIHAALEKAFERRDLTYKRTFYFPTIGEYTPLMESAGLRPDYAVLFDRRTRLEGENGMLDWINMFDSLPFEGLEERLCDEIKAEAVDGLRKTMLENGVWYADYVRIRIRAVKL